MLEEWKDIVGYEGLYQVSNLGRVKSLRKNKIRKPTANSRGYKQVDLWKSGKVTHTSIHRLVAFHFLEVPVNYKEMEVNHKDEDKTNNRADNLEWCTRKYNQHYGTRNQRIANTLSKPVVCIDNGTIYPSVKFASLMFGNLKHINCCCDGNRKTAGGLKWEWLQ